MTAVFVDTSFYVAMANSRDADHPSALAILRQLTHPILTTEYVLVETGNWLASAGDRESFVRLADAVVRDRRTTVVPASNDPYRRGLTLFRNRLDKEWGMIDCISFEVMNMRGLNEALTADRHFQQAGFRALMLETR